MMARQVTNLDKLAEAQEAVEAAGVAMEAATLAAEKVAEIRIGDDLTAGPVATPEVSAKAQEADGGGMADGYSAHGFPSEAAARQWVYDQRAAEDR